VPAALPVWSLTSADGRLLMQYGVSTHLYHGVRLNRDHLVEIAAHGFEAVELRAATAHFDCYDDRAIADIAGHLGDAGLRAHALHAPGAETALAGAPGMTGSVADGDDAVRRRAVDETVAAIRAAHELGAEVVVVHPGTPAAHAPSPKDNRRDALVRSLEALHDVAAPLGIRLALEIIPGPLGGADALVRLLEEDMDVDGIGLCLDTGHAHIEGDVVEAIETASGYLITTHLHDNAGRCDTHDVPFDGGIDWPAALMAFRKVGYDGTWIFDVRGHQSPRATLERLQRARRRIEEMLAG
jgi:sugar phosphate isomerase/epimerase